MLVQLLCVGPRCPSDVCHLRCRVTALPNGELPWRGTAGQADRGATCRSSLEIRPTPSAEKRAVLNASWGSPHILTFSNRCHYIYSRRASDRNTRSALTLVIWNRHAVYSVSRDRRGIEQSPMHRTLPQSALADLRRKGLVTGQPRFCNRMVCMPSGAGNGQGFHGPVGGILPMISEGVIIAFFECFI
jgi:hypothetical protein